MGVDNRPAIRDFEVEYEQGGEVCAVVVPSLDDVLKGSLIDLRNSTGLSTRGLAHRLGCRQQTINSFLTTDQTIQLKTLTAICASLGMGTSELFALNPDYDDSNQRPMLGTHLKAHLPSGTLEQLVAMALLSNRVGGVVALIDNLYSMVTSMAEAQGSSIADTTAEARRIVENG